MTRSLKKNPFVANHLLRKINKLNTKAEKEIIGISLDDARGGAQRRQRRGEKIAQRGVRGLKGDGQILIASI